MLLASAVPLTVMVPSPLSFTLVMTGADGLIDMVMVCVAESAVVAPSWACAWIVRTIGDDESEPGACSVSPLSCAWVTTIGPWPPWKTSGPLSVRKAPAGRPVIVTVLTASASAS
jgi:hypothetical protein